ncbi:MULTISPECIES: hypothetical protein [Caproicibacterium]|uniref:Uncharacterized protein n=1 Tax=Caproicibacterium argilliputei TaxID=3030016 RepID=A0AA97DAR8_9FIRM|nr:hypothetical protein [Caproicibacterium argilliputei]WOC33461.1 hypothetical protein PXC00_06235 [Caproicibacterium argilliputei]
MQKSKIVWFAVSGCYFALAANMIISEVWASPVTYASLLALIALYSLTMGCRNSIGGA